LSSDGFWRHQDAPEEWSEKPEETSVSILQTRGRKSEEWNEKPDKEIPTTEELAESQLTPFHAQGSESLLQGTVGARYFERLFMVCVWVCDSRDNTMGQKQKRNKTTLRKDVEG